MHKISVDARPRVRRITEMLWETWWTPAEMDRVSTHTRICRWTCWSQDLDFLVIVANKKAHACQTPECGISRAAVFSLIGQSWFLDHAI